MSTCIAIGIRQSVDAAADCMVSHMACFLGINGMLMRILVEASWTTNFSLELCNQHIVTSVGITARASDSLAQYRR